MNHHFLRESAKVAIGLFIADIVCGIWLGSTGFFPLTMLGVTWPASSILPFVFFDVVVIVLLAHFAWNTHVPVRSPSEKGLLVVAGCVFLAVALLHLVRLAFGVSLILGGFEIPLWLSWIGVAVTAYLSYASFHFAFRKTR